MVQEFAKNGKDDTTVDNMSEGAANALIGETGIDDVVADCRLMGMTVSFVRLAMETQTQAFSIVQWWTDEEAACHAFQELLAGLWIGKVRSNDVCIWICTLKTFLGRA